LEQSWQTTRRKHLGCLLISFMKTSLAELIATPQFDSGRWKLRLERVPVSADKQFNGPLVSSVAVGFTMLTPTGLPDRGVPLGAGCWLMTARHRTDRPSRAQGRAERNFTFCEMAIAESLIKE
jgi:hypothetical protein